MTETKILELLTKNLGGNTSNTFTDETLHFSKLSLDCVQSISKNIADILYNSLTTKSTSNEKKRLDVLLLLQKWCANGRNHIKIDHNNYDCLINALKPCTLIDDELQTRIKWDDCDETCKSNFNVLLSQHYKKIELINKEKSKCVEMIRNRDRNKCGESTMFVPSTSNNPKHTELSDKLKQLMDLQGCEEIIPVNKLNDHDISKHNDPLMRLKQISLAQSLLNLNKSSNELSLLTNILKNLSSYEILQPSEAQFINYLWQKSMTEDLPFEIQLLLLENFRFIYEKIIIKLCTDALQTSSNQGIPVMSEGVQKILQLSGKSERLRHNVTNLFYELYACSGFNNKLCCFLTLIR